MTTGKSTEEMAREVISQEDFLECPKECKEMKVCPTEIKPIPDDPLEWCVKCWVKYSPAEIEAKYAELKGAANDPR